MLLFEVVVVDDPLHAHHQQKDRHSHQGQHRARHSEVVSAVLQRARYPEMLYLLELVLVFVVLWNFQERFIAVGGSALG